ncbi:MAG TPA: rhamnulokinase family protein [Acidimicrobiales bacterium]|nr:rhamnulokinase family protein [Acidimicrobiales bacterium]
MSGPYVHAAIDLGASSARLFGGRLDGGRLITSEVARAPNAPVRLPDGWHWDILRLHQGMLEGLAVLSREVDAAPIWAGFDGWGVDYGLLDPGGRLLGSPFCYRDGRTAGLVGTAGARVGRGRIYEATGIQEMEINTVYQLMAEQAGTAYAVADKMLLLPDLLSFFLTGERRFELTNASTTQLVDARTGNVVDWLVEALGLRRDLFALPVLPGEVIGPAMPEVMASAEIRSPLSVVAVGSHDTASAVLAVPANREDFAYVVSGTWSLVGFELERPVIDEPSREANFSNELGVDGTVRFLRNAMGHWMLQECGRHWAGASDQFSLPRLLAEAARCPPFVSLVDTARPEFARPGDMPERVRAACAAHGEPVPGNELALVRCIVDSIALAIAGTLRDAERCAGRQASVVHVVGGGTANELLLDLVAAATGLEVRAGPVEASALGNLLVQLRAAGRVGDRWEMRALVASSFPVKRVRADPELAALAERAQRRLADIVAKRESASPRDRGRDPAPAVDARAGR